MPQQEGNSRQQPTRLENEKTPFHNQNPASVHNAGIEEVVISSPASVCPLMSVTRTRPSPKAFAPPNRSPPYA
jgi:hypothetical protein